MTTTPPREQLPDLADDLAKWEAHVRRYDAEGACNPLANTLQQAREALRAQAASVEAVEIAWPKLDKAARVGAGTFGTGVSSRLVVEAAQRNYEYMVEGKPLTPDDARAQERSRRSLWELVNGQLDPTPAHIPADVSPPQAPQAVVEAERCAWLIKNIIAYECVPPSLVIKWPEGVTFDFSNTSRSIDAALIATKGQQS